MDTQIPSVHVDCLQTKKEAQNIIYQSTIAMLRIRKKGKHPSKCLPTRFTVVKEFITIARRNGASKRSLQNSRRTDKQNVTRELSWDQKLHILSEQFPACPREERVRFLRARNGNIASASKKLELYLKFRNHHGLDSTSKSISDRKDWNESYANALASVAAKMHCRKSFRSESQSNNVLEIPQILFVYSNVNGDIEKTFDGSFVLHCVPARIDLSLATAETYALTMTFYLDKKFDRERRDYATLMLDVRRGEGWPNPSLYNLMPLIRMLSSLLHQNYPERICKCFIYNLPRAPMWIWDMVKPFLNRFIIEAIVPISGSDCPSAEPPNDILSKFINLDLLENMERNRKSF